MSEYKALQALIRDDTKTFETELNKLNNIENYSELRAILNFIIYTNNIDQLYTFINFMTLKDIIWCAPNLHDMANNNQWEMLKLIKESLVFSPTDFFQVFEGTNLQTLDKVLEYNIMTNDEIEKQLKGPFDRETAQSFKQFHDKYPHLMDKETYKGHLLESCVDQVNMFALTELSDMIESIDDLLIICGTGFDLEKYNILVQKVSNERIIDALVNRGWFMFDSNLIDVIGIRAQLQAKIDQFEVKDNVNERTIFGRNLLKYSGLNFRKKVMRHSLDYMCIPETKTVLRDLPLDYFTNQEKSDYMIAYIRFIDYIQFLIQLGWKVYDTPENREKCARHMKTYDRISKY